MHGVALVGHGVPGRFGGRRLGVRLRCRASVSQRFFSGVRDPCDAWAMRLGGVRRVVVAGFFVVALASSAATASVANADTSSAAAAAGALDGFAGLVALPSGREVYLECRGDGSPTVILESGGGLAASQWSVLAPGSTSTPVLAAVSRFTRVCAYDRPGTVQVPDGTASRSDPVPLPRTFADMVIELRELLEAADVPARTCWPPTRWAARWARLFAGQNPDRRRGVRLARRRERDHLRQLRGTRRSQLL